LTSLEGNKLDLTPRVLDGRIRLKGYKDDLRQVTVPDLGHDDSTLPASDY